MPYIDVSVEVPYLDYTFLIEGLYSPPRAGRISGPPEDCYPDEPSEWESVHVYAVGDSTDLADLFESLLTPDGKTSFLDFLCTEAESRLGR